MTEPTIAARLEAHRAALRAENISYGELADLQGLAERIDSGDAELLEAAGVPEFSETYQYSHEGIVGGVQYVTVLDAGGNPVEYNVEFDDAVRRYPHTDNDD